MRNGDEEMRLGNEIKLGKAVYASHNLVPCMYGFLLREISAVLILASFQSSCVELTDSIKFTDSEPYDKLDQLDVLDRLGQ